MNLNIIIEQVEVLPSDLDQELLTASIQEGFEPIEWLREDWEEGKNRFEKPGEAFYVARSEGRLIGVCGLNRDPYADDDSIGRLRRLYVHPDFRRMGVGRSLVKVAVRRACSHFTAVRLRTLDQQSAAFFEALGFGRAEHQQSATHVMELYSSTNLNRGY